jgi:two-component system, cell cycle sensor histidine kinase and response regulator CckA
MTSWLGEFRRRYAEALASFVANGDEEGLERGYELGREAITQGLGVIEIASVHGEVGAEHEHGAQPDVDLPRRLGQFFAEALAPFEMALRGFREANASLRESAATLERRVEERTRDLADTERALRERTRLLTAIVESIADGIIVADRSGKVVLANQASRRIGVTNLPAGEWASALGIFRGDTVTPFPQAELPLFRAIHGEQTKEVEVFVRNDHVPDGVHLSTIGSPLHDESGTAEGGVVVFRDVSDRKRAAERLRVTEEQLRQSQKMDAVGRLAGGIAHDFNNILSVILSYSEFMLQDLREGEPMRDEVVEIQKGGQRAAELTRQLLMFSRQQVIQPRVIDLNDTVKNIERMLVRILGADVDLVSLPTVPLGRVRADSGSIEQLLLNLVVNARDAMPTGGKLTIETSNITLDDDYVKQHLGARTGPHVMLAVTDTGVGMDATTRARIFEPFFTTKPQGKGTGLGLSTVFGIVQQSAGSVWVYSEPGHGTTFKVYLPCVGQAVDAPSSSPPEPLTLCGSETVLLVDDDDQVRATAAAILRRNRYHVIEARNAGEALLHAERHPGNIDLLLSDVVMPQMSGPELAHRLAGSRPALRVLCMSGYTDDSVVRHGVLESKVAYVQKPLTPNVLLVKVRETLDSPRRYER